MYLTELTEVPAGCKGELFPIKSIIRGIQPTFELLYYSILWLQYSETFKQDVGLNDSRHSKKLRNEILIDDHCEAFVSNFDIEKKQQQVFTDNLVFDLLSTPT